MKKTIAIVIALVVMASLHIYSIVKISKLTKENHAIKEVNKHQEEMIDSFMVMWDSQIELNELTSKVLFE